MNMHFSKPPFCSHFDMRIESSSSSKNLKSVSFKDLKITRINDAFLIEDIEAPEQDVFSDQDAVLFLDLYEKSLETEPNVIVMQPWMNNTHLVIVKPSQERAAEIVTFLNNVGGQTEFLPFGLNEYPLYFFEKELLIKECLQQNLCLMVTASIEKEMVGYLFLERSNMLRLVNIGNINLIVVNKDHWNESIGSRMMHFTFDWALRNNITKIQLQVRTDNQRAIKFFEKFGFKIEGTVSEALKIKNIYFENYIMGFSLLETINPQSISNESMHCEYFCN